MVSTPSLKPIAILTGPTASGKTALAFELTQSLADQFEIINADSLLIYRGMDIGTAKPTPEERRRIPHHLIDIREPHEVFTAGDFKRAAERAIEEIESRGKRALIVGGTGFYLKALLYGLWPAPESDPRILAELEQLSSAELLNRLAARDESSALRIGVNDRYRLLRAVTLLEMTGKTPAEFEASQADRAANPRFALWIIDRPNEELFTRINARTRAMIERGLVEETRALLEKYPKSRALEAVGYRETVSYLKAQAPAGRKLKPGLDGLFDEIVLSTRQLVKKQRTWFRGQAPTATHFELSRDADSLQAAWRALLTI